MILVNVPAFLETERLILRQFRESDHAPFAALNADPKVMEHMLKPLTRAESDDFIRRIGVQFGAKGYSLWALERKSDSAFIGYTGLWPAPPEVPFEPKVEIGWRLAHAAWGQGYVTEAARAAMADGFARGMNEITSFTSFLNTRSIAVMERLRMTRDTAGDFNHPRVPKGHPLEAHLLYRMSKDQAHAVGMI